MTLPEASKAGDDTDFNTHETKHSRQSVVSLVSDLPLPGPVGSHEIWNPSQGGRCGHFSEAQSADCLM